MKQYILQQKGKIRSEITELVTYLPNLLNIGDVISLKNVVGNWTVVSVGRENLINPELEDDEFYFFNGFVDYKQIFGFSEYYLSDELTKKHFCR